MKSLKLFVCALGFVALGMSSLQSSYSQSPATSNTVKGSYVFTEQGTLNPTSPYAGLGMLVLDGQGGATGWQTIQTSGVNAQTTFTGTYSIDSKGVGKLVLNHNVTADPVAAADPNFAAQSFTTCYKFLITDNNTEMRGIRTENGVFVISRFVKQQQELTAKM